MTILAEDAQNVQDELPPEDENDLKCDWRKFSPDFARRLNPARPDYAGSALFNELILWTNTKSKNRCRVSNQCFRSLDELAQDCPYVAGGIEEAVKRLECKFKSKFLVARSTKCHWFTIDPQLIKEYRKDKGLWFKRSVAGQHGILKAVLKANVEFQVRPGRECETDDAGNRFGELSPRKLTKPNYADCTILPWPEDTVKRALKQMRTTDGLLIQHLTKKGLHALVEGFVYPEKNDNRWVTETEGRVSGTETWVSETDTLPCTEVIRSNGEIKYQSLHCQGSAAPPLVRVAEAKKPEGLDLLMSFAKQSLADLRSRQGNGFKASLGRVSDSLLPYDCFESVNDDLPYDFIPQKQIGLITLRSQEITEAVNSIKTNWRVFQIPYTNEDIQKLMTLFVHNPAFQVEHWEKIEMAIVEAQFQLSVERGHWDNESILRRVKTAKARLQYLPQIIRQIFVSTGYEKQYDSGERHLVINGEIPEPFASLEFSCLGNFTASKLVGNESPTALEKFFGGLPDNGDHQPSDPSYLGKLRAKRTELIEEERLAA